MNGINEIVEQLLAYLRGMWRYRWYALVLAWLISLAGWVHVAMLPDQYQASARVYVDTQSILRPLLHGLAISVDPSAQITLMTRTLLSRPNLAKVARMTDLDLQAQDSEAMDDLLDELKEKIGLTGAGQQNLYTITVLDEDPQLARRIVQAVLTMLVENTLGETRQDSDTAQRFLDRQISEYEARLVAAEDRLKEFKRRHVGMMPGSGDDYYVRMQEAGAALESVKLQLRQAENRQAALQRQIQGEEPTFGLDPNVDAALTSVLAPTVNLPVQNRIQTLETQLDTLLLKYTERHPDVISTRQMIAELEQQRDDQLSELTANMASLPNSVKASIPSLDVNPVYQQLKIAYGNESANIAALQAQLLEYENKLKELQKRIHTVPEIEAQLTALNRDYSVTKSNYEALLARRESAHISQQAGQTTDDIRFKVIEPPRAATEPAQPNRPKLMSVVLAAGVSVGLGVAFLVGQIWPTFDNRRSLMQATNIPVFGSVGAILSPVVIRRQRLALYLYLFLAVSLLVVFVGLITLEMNRVEIPLNWPW